jgi:glycerol dehydrogenase
VIALRDAQAGQVSEAVERVIEASVLLSTLSFENAGLSVAHAIARGIPYVQRAAGTLHGEHVAYGLLVQLVLEDRPREFYDDILGFYVEMGLPWQLAHLQLARATDAEIREIVEGTMVSPSVKRFSEVLTPERLADAIRTVEQRAGSLRVKQDGIN